MSRCGEYKEYSQHSRGTNDVLLNSAHQQVIYGGKPGKFLPIATQSAKLNSSLAHKMKMASWAISILWVLSSTTMEKALNSDASFQKRRFLKVKKIKTAIWLPNHVTNDVMKFFSVDHFIPRWPSKMFILIGCGVLHMQLWSHKKKSHSFPMMCTCYLPSFNFFLVAVSEIEV